MEESPAKKYLILSFIKCSHCLYFNQATLNSKKIFYDIRFKQ